MSAEPQSDQLAEVAAKLLGERVREILPGGGGGNSRIWRVESVSGTYALKRYPTIANDPRDRLGTEKRTLEFLARHHVDCVPRWLGGESPYGLLSWVEGTLPAESTAADMEAALAFLSTIRRLSASADANAMSPASEACLSAAEIERQIRTRLERLAPAATQTAELQQFLQEQFTPVMEKRFQHLRDAYGKAGMDYSTDIPFVARCLIPADFGFHNALKDAQARLTFIDFEYFGWDDPVKLSADFLLHPAMQLSPALKSQFLAGVQRIFGTHTGFAPRLQALYPCFGLRWTLILLNEFLPERLKARAFARGEADLEGLKVRQLQKARTMLDQSQILPG